MFIFEKIKIIMRKLVVIILLLTIINSSSFSQNVGIGTNTPYPSAALDITDSTKGILIPRMTMTQRSNIQNPAEGLMVYQTDITNGFWYYSNNIWNRINATSQGNLNNSNGGNMVVYKTSGTFIAPQGVNSVIVELWGGGGGGAISGGTAGKMGSWGKSSVMVSPGISYPVTVGAGGGSSVTGENGTPSSFNGIYAKGGNGANCYITLAGCPTPPLSNATLSCNCEIPPGSILGYGKGGPAGSSNYGGYGLVIIYY